MRPFQLLIIVLAGWCSAAADEPAHPIWVIAHRGAAAEAPENTLAAIEAAVKMGCDVVEVDVRLSRDGRAVLMHDGTVDRTTNGRGRVEGLTWAQLRELDAGVGFSTAFRGTRIPQLQEAIDVVRARAKLYLDLKVTDFEPIVSVVRQAKFSKSVFYRVYRPGDVARIRRLDPSSRVIIDIGQLSLLPGAAEVLLKQYPDVVLSLDIGSWTEQLENTLKRHSSQWFLNVLGRETHASELQRALDRRPTGIMTDSPRVLLDLLRRSVGESRHSSERPAFLDSVPDQLPDIRRHGVRIWLDQAVEDRTIVTVVLEEGAFNTVLQGQGGRQRRIRETSQRLLHDPFHSVGRELLPAAVSFSQKPYRVRFGERLFQHSHFHRCRHTVCFPFGGY